MEQKQERLIAILDRECGGQKTDRSPTMRGIPLTSSGAICVPSNDLHSKPAALAAS